MEGLPVIPRLVQRHAKLEPIMPHEPLPPIICAHLLRRVDEELILLLNSLAPGE